MKISPARLSITRSLIAAAATAFLVGTSPAADSIPLWPDGKTPHANAKDAETGKPKLFTYLVPKEKANGCAVVVTPGGGYGGLAADHEGHQIAVWWNERGVSAFVLHYRLGPEGHHFPTQLADVQRAIRTVRAKAADYGVDPRRIGVMGFSAGGHLASMASTKFNEKAYDASDAIDEASARPDFAVLCYPVIAMASEFAHGGSRKNLLGGEFAPDSPEARHVSSDLNVTAETPPTFIFQTDEDTAVPAENAVRYYLALRKHKIPAEMHIYQRGPHGVGLYLGDPITGTWSVLLDTWVRANGFYAPAPQRVAVAGEVTLNGNPVRWGSVTFHPAAGVTLPVVTARVMAGKFSLPADQGPVVGGNRLTFSASTWETTQNEADRVIQADRLSQNDPSPAMIEVTEGLAPLKFALQSP
ncbi:MAG: alpha/beta hydrolase [Verrucomicrobiales bacterium]|nr:alpha/beta hydrolase [Verrucomicrobiales bacterium]